MAVQKENFRDGHFFTFNKKSIFTRTNRDPIILKILSSASRRHKLAALTSHENFAIDTYSGAHYSDAQNAYYY